MPDGLKGFKGLQRAKNQQDLIQMALVVALDRVGGSLVLTDAEYRAAAEKYGGVPSLGLELHATDEPTGPQVRITLVRKKPKAATDSRVM